MQTFLPYPDFAESARVLDRQRLGKQRVECLQLLRALLVPGSGWANHPAVKMWRGRERALVAYQNAVCHEWTKVRGYKDKCWEQTAELAFRNELDPVYVPEIHGPSWLGDPAFHTAHRSNLLRKNPEWYGRFGWTELNDLPYIWPV